MPAVRLRFPFVPADPISFWKNLHPAPRNGFFLGSGARTKEDHIIYMSIGEPIRSTVINSPEQFHRLESHLKKGNTSENIPRFVGFLGFEAGRLFDPGIARLPKQTDPLKIPKAFFCDYPAVVKIDLLKKEMALLISDPKHARSADFYRRKIESVYGAAHSIVAEVGLPGTWKHASLRQFESMVQIAKEAISRGDIYQANLSIRFQKAFRADPILFYQRLCEKNPSPYACLIKGPYGWIVSCSPELLMSVRGRTVETRPIAGTRPRGTSTKKDQRLKGQLLLSPKERAEHIMLVDLERNDLGRVCTPGSVRVSERTAVEKYSHVMHIVSQVEGHLAKGKTSWDALKALFPGGTITGCPKIRSIEIIENLEKISRGPFYGSAGYFSANGDSTFNILIRTALIQKGRISIQAGAGIVADSRPEKEYREVLAKARVLLEAAGEL